MPYKLTYAVLGAPSPDGDCCNLRSATRIARSGRCEFTAMVRRLATPNPHGRLGAITRMATGRDPLHSPPAHYLGRTERYGPHVGSLRDVDRRALLLRTMNEPRGRSMSVLRNGDLSRCDCLRGVRCLQGQADGMCQLLGSHRCGGLRVWRLRHGGLTLRGSTPRRSRLHHVCGPALAGLTYATGRYPGYVA